jgi:hypothetical protein
MCHHESDSWFRRPAVARPIKSPILSCPVWPCTKAYPGPDLRKVAAKVADQSRKKSRKVAKGRGRPQNKEKRCHMNRSFTIISNNCDKVAQRRKLKSRKVPEGRTKSRNVACNHGNLQVQDRHCTSILESLLRSRYRIGLSSAS